MDPQLDWDKAIIGLCILCVPVFVGIGDSRMCENLRKTLLVLCFGNSIISY